MSNIEIPSLLPPELEPTPEDMGCIDVCSYCIEYGDPCRGDRPCGGIREMTDEEKRMFDEGTLRLSYGTL